MAKIDSKLDSLNDSGTPPRTRITEARQAKSIYEMLWRADTERSSKRQQVKGLVDGNPPYRQADLRAAGRDDKCNINWRTAESYFNNAVGLFYDLYGEAPTYATIQLNGGTPEQNSEWSRKVTTHFDWLCRYEPEFDYHVQLSQDEMVLYGCGPVVFEDQFCWMPKSILCGQLKVPERAKSDTSLWELGCVEMDYLPHELYGFILNEKEASAVGWNVERVKQSIIDASPESQKGGMYRNWEYHQQQLKMASLSYSYTSRIISVVHLFYREFCKPGEKEGRISQVIIIRDSRDDKPDTFLFQNVGRYANWNECIHPMYYDRGGGGFHHSVTGMGVKMFSVLALQNRLLCNLADKAMTPKIMFKPTTATAADQFSLQQFGDYSVIGEGFEAMQTPISGVMEEAMVFQREIGNLVSTNLSQYRSKRRDEKGNPATATQVQLDAQNEAALQKTQMNRYYIQLDSLYAEMYRRACDSYSVAYGGPAQRAKEFIERCIKDGVPKEALKKVEFVKASRVVGQGSEFLRQQSTEFLFGTVMPMLPETGRTNLIDDVIASRAGQSAVNRYNPKQAEGEMPDDQYARAMSQVADMKIGVPAVPTATQNPAVFAQVFLEAMGQAVSTLEQGANPQEVASFLDLAGKATAGHLQRMAADPSRKQMVKQMTEQLMEFGKIHDQLVENMQAEAEARAQMQQQANDEISEQQLALMKLNGDLALKSRKTEAGIQDKALKTQASIAIKDASTAHALKLQSDQHRLDMMRQKSEGENKD